VALTGRRHQVVSDARQRFERGIDLAIMPAAVEAATRVILDLCGGEPGAVVSAGAPPDWRRSATLRFERLAGLGGLDVPPEEAVASLQRLGFIVERRDAAQVTVAVPSWRNDVAAVRTDGAALEQAMELDPAVAEKAADGCALIEPECDLLEEVLRLRGLDSIPAVSVPPVAPVPLPTLTRRQTRAALAGRTLAAQQGLTECVTFSFMAAPQAALFGAAPESLRLTNPIAADLDQLRPTPVATLALAAQRNAARGWSDVALFEVGPGFAEDGQRPIAAGLRTGAAPRSWIQPASDVDAIGVKADLYATLVALGVPMDALMVTADAPGFYHPGRSGTVRQGPKTVLGNFGELHPRVLEEIGLAGPAAAFELYLDAIADPKRRRRAPPDLPAFQPVRRDFAFVVDADVPADAMLRAARGADRTLITAATLFDVYAGEALPAGKKSLAIEVMFQPRERTLTDAEIEAAAQKVVSAVSKATGGVLR
jgi:phenylalanyl-tRNA synthetase beta chain